MSNPPIYEHLLEKLAEVYERGGTHRPV